jgi:DNA ligase-1
MSSRFASDLQVPSNNLNGPDVWFEPKAVWEVAAADLSLSPAHMAGSGLTGGEGRGVALRFPRFLKVRDDKQPEDATSSQQIVDMFNAQKNQQDSPKKKARDAAAASDSALVSEEESLGPSDLE